MFNEGHYEKDLSEGILVYWVVIEEERYIYIDI